MPRRLAKTAALGLGSLLLLSVAAFLLLLARPQLALNSRTAAWAFTRFAAAFEPRWGSLTLDVGSLGLLRKRVEFEVRGLCLAGRRPPWRACFERLAMRAEIDLGSSGLELVRLSEIDVDAREIWADLSQPRPKTVQPAASRAPSVPKWLARLRVGRLAARLPVNRIVLATGTLTGSVSLGLPSFGRRALTVLVNGRLARPTGPEHVTVRGELLSDVWEGTLTKLDALLRVEAGKRGRVRLEAKVRPEADGRLRLNAAGKVTQAGRTLAFNLMGNGNLAAQRGTLSARFVDPKSAVRSVALERCRLETALTAKRGSFACRYTFEPKPMDERAPRRLTGSVSADGSLKNGRDLDARARLTIEPAGDWYRFSGNLELAANGRLGKGAAGLRLRHEARTELLVHRFEDLVEYFRQTSFAVPAPLNAMRGRVLLRVAGSGDSRRDPQHFSVEGLSDLGGGVQRLRTKLKGELLARRLWTPLRRLELGADWALEDVVVQLPYLELQSPPKVALDPRIRSGEEAELRLALAPKPAPSPLRTVLRLRTPAKPVRLHTNLIEDAVPLRLDLRVAPPAGVSGRVWTEPFGIELFRRKATVERFQLTQSSSSKTGELDASIRHKSPEAVIRILIIGTTEKPRVQFTSEPPMDRSQILSLLLFGKPPSALASDEAESVGNTNAALTEQAFGLASLFVFASTPIEYVGYNPDSQSYVVRFRLPGGATAELGSDLEDKRSLRVRKRLTRSLALETELRREATMERNAVTTFLEWFRRY